MSDHMCYDHEYYCPEGDDRGCPFCRIAQLENPWVSVDTVLPESDTYVLACKPEWETPEKMHFSLHDGIQYWDARSAEKHHMRVDYIPTHWMPLPEPPK